MAIVTRRYTRVGVTDPDLTNYVAPSAVINANYTNAIDINIDNAAPDVLVSLDEYMSQQGFVFSPLAVAVNVGVDVSPWLTAEWRINNVLSAVNAIDTAFLLPAATAYTIVEVSLYRATAGLGGSTVVDLLAGTNGVAASTLYTTPANRPTVMAASGNFRHVTAALPDVVALAAGARLEVNVVSVETGAPMDAVLRVLLRRT